MSTPDTDTLTAGVVHVFAGPVGRLANDGAPSAIHKQAVHGRRWLGRTGLQDDAQADHVHHGGPERALNHLPLEHYDIWRQRYPGYDDALAAGALGENLSTRGITEADVYVGDIFTCGEAVIEIAQPRQPCWKPGARVGIAGLARAMAGDGRAGWFYRVHEEGWIAAGDRLVRRERAGHGISLAETWQLIGRRTVDDAARARLMTLVELASLAPEWRKRLAAKARQARDRAAGSR